MIKAEIRDELSISGQLVRVRETKANSEGKIQIELKIMSSNGYKTVFIPKGFGETDLIVGNEIVLDYSQPLAGVTGYINGEGEEILHGIDSTTGKLWEGLVKNTPLNPKLEGIFSYSQKTTELNAKLKALESLEEEQLDFMSKYNTVAQLV